MQGLTRPSTLSLIGWSSYAIRDVTRTHGQSQFKGQTERLIELQTIPITTRDEILNQADPLIRVRIAGTYIDSALSRSLLSGGGGTGSHWYCMLL